MRFVVCFLMLAALITGCRQQAAAIPTNAPPTIAPTPRSTALPTVESQSAFATESNPLRMMVVTGDSVAVRERAQDGALTLETALREQSASYVERGFIAEPLSIRIDIVETNAAALEALCAASTEDTRAVAWLDGLGFASAEACASPALLVERGSGRSAATGERFALITRRALSLGSAAASAGRSICRLGFDDRATWVISSLIVRANGVDPLTQLGDVVEVEDNDALYTALINEDCDLAGIRVTDFDALDDSIAEDLVLIEGSETPELPYNVLFYPPDVPLGTQIALNGVLLALVDAQPEALAGLLQLDGLLALKDTAEMMESLAGESAATADIDLDALRAFLFSTGLNFANLGE
jgi:hypothetical protein